MDWIMGKVSPVKKYQVGNYEIDYRQIVHDDGLVQVEYYIDSDPDNPTAFSKFRERLSILPQELRAWKTIVADPIVGMELAARKVEEKVLNPLPKGSTKFKNLKGTGIDPRMWYSGSTDALENVLCISFISYTNTNVIAITHINERKNEVSGEIIRGPSAPGRLASRQEINAFYQEQYLAYTDRDADGNRVHLLKTRNDGTWAASSLIDAPDPLFPHYESMWEQWQSDTRPATKTLIYGSFGTGKSTFAQTFPKPMLVFSFDGKDLPYWRCASYF